MSRPSMVTVLAEDQSHQRFVRPYLERLGLERRQIRFEPLPSGRGCGEQWVRENYRRAVDACRQRARGRRAETALVVVIDADTGKRTREDQLAHALEVPRQPDERIAHFIPKRNIETWVLCLTGESIDETTDYSHDERVENRLRTAGEAFFRWSRSGSATPPHCIPSLAAAIPEAQRIG